MPIASTISVVLGKYTDEFIKLLFCTSDSCSDSAVSGDSLCHNKISEET